VDRNKALQNPHAESAGMQELELLNNLRRRRVVRERGIGPRTLTV